MHGEELLESLDRHFIAGCPSLSTSQLRAHQARGVCPECQARAAAAALVQAVTVNAAILAKKAACDR